MGINKDFDNGNGKRQIIHVRESGSWGAEARNE